MRAAAFAFVALFAATGCTVSRAAGHRDVARVVQERIGVATHWDQGSPEDAEVARVVDNLLRQGLTRERAVEISLVNNRTLQATYEELGVSQAEMVQAGLLKNPTLQFGIGFPLNAAATELEGSLVQDFLDLLVLPMRKKIARERFDAEIMRVTHEALQVAAEVQKAFVAVQATQEMVAYRRTVTRTAQVAAELSDRLFDAGNITDVAHDGERAAFEQAALELSRDELELANARERLNRLLGLWGTQTGWTIAGPLPSPPADEPPLEHLESTAIRQRLDVEAARMTAALMTRAVALARDFRLFGRIELGAQGHKDPDGPRVLGPQITLELPIFDQRQAEIARLEALRRQAERRLEEVSIDARSEVRAARLALMIARSLVERYRKTLVPLRDRIVEETQLRYNGMLTGAFQLLEAKRQQVEAHRAYVEAVRDYWSARAELERAAGGRLPQGGR